MRGDGVRRRVREAQAIPRSERRFTPDAYVHLDTDVAEALCDLADAADEHFQVELTHERSSTLGLWSSAWGLCARCGCQWPCPTERMRAALARLDGEDTG